MRNCQTGKYSAESQKILNEISTAKVCLLNAEKKAAYDQRLKVEMVYLNDSGEVVGLGHSEDAKLIDKSLSFRRVFDKNRSSDGWTSIPPSKSSTAGCNMHGVPVEGRGRESSSELQPSRMDLSGRIPRPLPERQQVRSSDGFTLSSLITIAGARGWDG